LKDAPAIESARDDQPAARARRAPEHGGRASRLPSRRASALRRWEIVVRLRSLRVAYFEGLDVRSASERGPRFAAYCASGCVLRWGRVRADPRSIIEPGEERRGYYRSGCARGGAGAARPYSMGLDRSRGIPRACSFARSVFDPRERLWRISARVGSCIHRLRRGGFFLHGRASRERARLISSAVGLRQVHVAKMKTRGGSSRTIHSRLPGPEDTPRRRQPFGAHTRGALRDRAYLSRGSSGLARTHGRFVEGNRRVRRWPRSWQSPFVNESSPYHSDLLMALIGALLRAIPFLHFRKEPTSGGSSTRRSRDDGSGGVETCRQIRHQRRPRSFIPANGVLRAREREAAGSTTTSFLARRR